jgi:FkbM family methyltransferase
MTRYRTWARSLLAPRERLLPGIGARLSRHPRAAGAVLSTLQRLPTASLRATSSRHIARPLLARLDATVEIRVAEGFRMFVKTSEPMGRVLAASGSWEPHVRSALRACLSAGDVCVDVGANIGYDALLAGALVGKEGRVFAIEPSPATHRQLVRNIELNGAANVVALRVAAGAEDGEVVLRDHPEGQSVRSSVSSTEAAGENGLRVPARTLASIVPREELPRLRVVKIDVEGYEVEVLRGLAPLFELGARPAVVVELHRGVVQEAVALLRDLGAQYGMRLYKLVNDSDSPVERDARVLPPWIDRVLGPDDDVPNGAHVVLIGSLTA